WMDRASAEFVDSRVIISLDQYPDKAGRHRVRTHAPPTGPGEEGLGMRFAGILGLPWYVPWLTSGQKGPTGSRPRRPRSPLRGSTVVKLVRAPSCLEHPPGSQPESRGAGTGAPDLRRGRPSSHPSRRPRSGARSHRWEYTTTCLNYTKGEPCGTKHPYMN